jgi:hypothetical protein
MIVLDANFLIRAVLGKRVLQLLETYTEKGVRFYAPEIVYADGEKYLPALSDEKQTYRHLSLAASRRSLLRGQDRSPCSLHARNRPAPRNVKCPERW